MKLSSVIDFYYLDALKHEHNKEAVNHSNMENIDVRYTIQRDTLNSLFEKAVDSIADSFYAYAFVSSFGEARHVRNKAQGGRIPRDLKTSLSRSESYACAMEYNPFKSRVALEEVFSGCHWSSAYGGNAWHLIIRSLDLYHDERVITDYYTQETRTVNGKSIFIDNLIDLKHNGGSLFDKSGALDLSSIDCDINERDLMAFLDYKRDNNILDNPPSNFTDYLSIEVSGLLGLSLDSKDSLNVKLDNDNVMLKFGDRILGESGYERNIVMFTCYKCDQRGADSDSHYYRYDLYCEDCYNRIQARREERAERREWNKAARRLSSMFNRYNRIVIRGSQS
jgi:hypothetical protein